MLQTALEHSRPPPELGWAPMGDLTRPPGRIGAHPARATPQQVARAQQPLLVSGVQLEAVAHAEQGRRAEQRWVVEMHYVEPTVEHAFELTPDTPGTPGEIVAEQRGKVVVE